MDATNRSIFGRNLRAFRSKEVLTQQDVGDAIGVSNAAVNLWENQGIQPRRKVIEDLMNTYGLAEDDLLSDSNGYYAKLHGLTAAPVGAIAPNEPRSAYAPLYGRVHAGTAEEPTALEDRIPIPFEVLENHKQGYFLEVEGDCMDKVYPPGCLVFVDPTHEPQNRSIAVVSIDGADFIMRRLNKGADTLLLSPESNNANWKDVVISHGDGHTVQFVGTVVWFQASKELE